MTDDQLKEYYARIGFVPREEENATDRLKRLHRCQSLSIPFEDLDPYCGIPVSLSYNDIHEKIIKGRRGGYCFELNRMFCELLEASGYEVGRILCRPYSSLGEKLALTHRLTTVPIDDTLWLADVGYGGNGIVEPLEFAVGKIQDQMGGRRFRIMQEAETDYVVQAEIKGRFENAIAFSFLYAVEDDFEMINYYTSTCPDSRFVNILMCMLPTETGRYTIRDARFKIENGGKRTELQLTSDNIDEILSHYYGIELTPQMQRHLHERLDKLAG